MKKILVILVAFIGFGIGAFAQNIITFYAWYKGGGPDGNSLTGHVMVDVPGRGVWGFSPSNPHLSLYKCVDGYMYREGHKIMYAQGSVSFQISNERLRKVQALLDDWINDTPCYYLGSRDCVSFGQRMAHAAGILDRYTYPWRTPRDFIDALERF